MRDINSIALEREVWSSDYQFVLFCFFYKAPPDGREAVPSLFGLCHEWLGQKYHFRWARKKLGWLIFSLNPALLS